MFVIELINDWRMKIFFWKIKGKNGEIIAHSENYSTFNMARKTARKFARHCKLDLIVKE